MRYRIASAVLGAWLFASVGVWHHNQDRAFLDLMMGLTLLTSGLCGVWLRSLRFFDGLCGILLVGSFLTTNYGSVLAGLHDVLIGLALVALSIPAGRDGEERLDHWVSRFDPNPTLERRSLFQQEIEG